MAPIATMAAYGQGEEWRRQLLRYLEGNVQLWLDCRAMGLKQEDLVDFFVNKARLALNDGTIFGPGGEGFMRLNIGEPRSVVHEALCRLSEAIKENN